MSNGHEHAGSPALLPCPFCGSSASMRHGARYGHWVQCDKCGAGHPLAFDTEADAARAWNRRSKAGNVVEAMEGGDE